MLLLVSPKRKARAKGWLSLKSPSIVLGKRQNLNFQFPDSNHKHADKTTASGVNNTIKYL